MNKITIEEDLDLFTDNKIKLNVKTINKGSVLKFKKIKDIVHKILIIKNLGKGYYEFANGYPIFNKTIILKGIEVDII